MTIAPWERAPARQVKAYSARMPPPQFVIIDARPARWP